MKDFLYIYIYLGIYISNVDIDILYILIYIDILFGTSFDYTSTYCYFIIAPLLSGEENSEAELKPSGV